MVSALTRRTSLTTLAKLDSSAQDLLMELNRSTGGRAEAQASMYTLGEAIGLAREASALAAEELMAHGLVEIRTLSGAIGLSDQGQKLLTEKGSDDDSSPRLGMDSPLNDSQRALVEQLVTTIKSDLGQSGLSFETLSEVVADIRTIEAQLASPKPKTPVVREILTSLQHSVQAGRKRSWQKAIEEVLA
jgi:hypothetical protein